MNHNSIGDSLKKNSIYLNLTKCAFDDILQSGNTYFAAGYSHSKNKFSFDFGGGLLIKHWPNPGYIGTNQKSANGFYVSIEGSYLFKPFYLGVQLLERYTESTDFDGDLVFRNSSALNLKAGKYINLKNNFVLDLSIGIGPKHVQSSTTNLKKKTIIKEFPTGKFYYSGSGIYPNILIEIKIHKTF